MALNSLQCADVPLSPVEFVAEFGDNRRIRQLVASADRALRNCSLTERHRHRADSFRQIESSRKCEHLYMHLVMGAKGGCFPPNLFFAPFPFHLPLLTFLFSCSPFYLPLSVLIPYLPRSPLKTSYGTWEVL